MKILLRVLLGLVITFLLLVGGVYFVACGPLNELRAQQLASQFQRAAEDVGVGEYVSYRVRVEPKGDAAVIIRADVQGLERAEVSRIVGLIQGQRREGAVTVRREVPAFELDGVRFSGVGHVDAAVFDVTAPVTGPGTAVDGVLFHRTGRMLVLNMGTCADAACRVSRAAPVLEIYPQIIRALQAAESGWDTDIVCLRLGYGPDREERYSTCTGVHEEADPERLLTVLETGVSFTGETLRDTVLPSTG